MTIARKRAIIGSELLRGIEVIDFTYGDVNDDGVVNVKDSLMLRMYIGGTGIEINVQAADVYYDGLINAKDSLYMRLNLAGSGVELGPQ